MAETLYDQIPSLELADFTNGSPRKKLEFVQTLGDAFTNISFFSRKNHDLSDNLSEKLYSSIDEFFDLPDGVKQKYEHPELAGKRGYLSKGKEKAKGRNTGDLTCLPHCIDTDPPKQSEDITAGAFLDERLREIGLKA